MKQRIREHKWLSGGLTGLFLVGAGFALSLFSAQEGRAETAENSVITTNTPWHWEYWDTPGEEDRDDHYSFARCVNEETGEILSDGWHIVDGYRYFFTPSGYARDQFHDGYFVGNTMGRGDFAEGTETEQDRYAWAKTKYGWRYGNKTTKDYLKSCRTWIDRGLYIFDQNGVLPEAGWYQEETTGDWYYIKASGNCTIGWQKIGKKWYFFDWTTGRMADAGGYDTRSPFAEKELSFVFLPNGAMREKYGWQQDADDLWYLSLDSGRAVTGYRKVQGTMYYFEPGLQGRMASSTDLEWFQSGWYMGESGKPLISGFSWHYSAGRLWYGNDHYYLSGESAVIDGWECQFTEKGFLMMGECYLTKETRYYKILNYTEEELYELAAVIYLEAGGEPYEGQLAVGNVIMNRVRSRYYPDNLYDVIHAPYQFSVVNNIRYEEYCATGGSETAIRAAREALEGVNNNVPGCIGFTFASSVDPRDPKYYIIRNIAFF